MTEPRTQRRLAAILAADVVGYSRLMQVDEAGTLAALKARWRDVLSPGVAQHRGRVVKVMGDGVLVEFASAVDAADCAVALQAGFAKANEGVPEDRRIVLRIGINLGDVIVEGADIYGDGVNIAARLEALAEPGGIYISGAVYDQVKRKLGTGFDDLGLQTVKNLAEPVRVFRVGGAPVPFAITPPVVKTAISVLPFVNMSDDAGQAYFTDGITEDIITELSRFRELRVASRNASFRYRDGPRDVSRIGRELGVQYLLEGSVRRVGKRIRITAQLTDIQSGGDLWAEKFDRDQEDLFAVQDEVTRVIVATLVGRIEDAVTTGAKRRPPASLAAYECVLRAEAMQYTGKADLLEARRLAERAVAIDPTYALAYSYLANTYRLEWLADTSGEDHLLDQALFYIRQALDLDENHDGCHHDLGLILMNRREWELAEHHLRRALALNPNNPVGIMCLGFLDTYLGKTDAALDLYETARALDPFFEPIWFWRMQGVAFFVARRYEDCISALRKSATIAAWAHGYIAACFAYLDQIELAKPHVGEALRLAPDFTICNAVAKEPFKHESDRQHLIEGMRRAGLPE